MILVSVEEFDVLSRTVASPSLVVSGAVRVSSDTVSECGSVNPQSVCLSVRGGQCVQVRNFLFCCCWEWQLNEACRPAHGEDGKAGLKVATS